MAHISLLIGCLSLFGWIYLSLFHGHFWRPLFADPSVEPEQWPSIDVVIPARDEADMLPSTLPSLLRQDYPGVWRILLVDDNSADDTREVAYKIAVAEGKSQILNIIDAPDLGGSWSGKIAAMQSGFSQSDADYVLFTDADIEHTPGSLRRLAARAIERKLDLTSLMVKLHCETLAEKLLIPAFVFFFAMLYPFEQANDPDSDVAAAAGGVMLVRRKALQTVGGFSSFKSALIDDCVLAKVIKEHAGSDDSAGRIELTLSPDVKSLRVYHTIGDVWDMVARTAYTQLHRSPFLLLATILGMAVLFIAPLLLPLDSDFGAASAATCALLMMLIVYVPMVLFYDLPIVWIVTLPLAAIIYILATIDSARLYWQGKGGLWKGRVHAS